MFHLISQVNGVWVLWRCQKHQPVRQIDLILPILDTLDLSDMRATGEQPGEQMMDTSNEPTGPTIDENLVNQLVEMGYPYHASRKALYHTSQQLEV